MIGWRCKACGEAVAAVRTAGGDRIIVELIGCTLVDDDTTEFDWTRHVAHECKSGPKKKQKVKDRWSLLQKA